MNQSPLFKQITLSFAILAGLLLCHSAAMASAQYNPGDNTVDIAAVDVPNGTSHVNSETFSVKLRVIDVGNGNIELELIDAALISPPNAERSHYDPVFGQAYIPDVNVNGTKYNAVLELIPNSNPLRLKLKHFHEVAFTGCPAFASPLPGVNGACVLPNNINQDVLLTNNVQWVIKSFVYIGGDNSQSATLTIEPGTRLVGRAGLDFLYIRRGSKIQAIGTPQHPVIMTGGINEQDPKVWGGLSIAGNAPINGCLESVPVCEKINEANSSELFGGNNPTDSSGVLKYVSIQFAGREIRPNEELNCLTLLGVGSGTTVDFVQCHGGFDDGFEMFGGTVNLKHLVSTGNIDDGFDWQTGWNGKAQFVFVKLASNAGNHGIEADNNELSQNSSPRSQGQISNATIIGNAGASNGHGILLRLGTSGNIYNSVITGFSTSCISINDEATYTNAGNLGNWTGKLTIENTYVNCANPFNDQAGLPFKVSDWFNAQPGNFVGDPQLNGHLPAFGSPLTSSAPPSNDDPFFVKTNYIGAFANENDDWTKGGWVFGME